MLLVVCIFAIAACVTSQTGSNEGDAPSSGLPTLPANDVVLPTPTPAAPEWIEIPLIDSPNKVSLANRTGDYTGREIYGTTIEPVHETKWIIRISVDNLTDSKAEVSTGVRIHGHTRDGNVETFALIYRGGFWSTSYRPLGWEEDKYSYWKGFDDLTGSEQYFELNFAADGMGYSLSNLTGFKIQETMEQKLFDGAEFLTMDVLVGPQTEINLHKLMIQVRPTENPAKAVIPLSGLPTPTAIPGYPDGAEYVFHVAVDGSDANPGTLEKPFATIEHAKEVIRTISDGMRGSIIVEIHGGTYQLDHPIQFTEADSGQNGYDVIYRAAPGEAPVFSGGISVIGWEPITDSTLWEANPGKVKPFRQMYVNGIRASRASSEATVTGLRFEEGPFSSRDGIEIAASKLPDLSRPSDLELHWIYDWKDMRLLVEDVQVNPSGTKTVWMEQPEFSTALWMGTWNNNTHYWYPKPEVPFYLENALELLDQPGEWYFNPESGELFYLPRPGEDMTTAEVVIPQTQSLLEITGGTIGHEVHNLAFEGITFAYAGWTRPSVAGSITNQAQQLLESAMGTTVMVPAHVEVNSAKDIRFEGCRFEHMGAVALHLKNNVSQVSVQGNLFEDISHSAIVVSDWEQAYITAPLAQRAPDDNLVANNLITKIGAEYWGAPAIKAYFVSRLRLVHNELVDLPHGGIAMGWGWELTSDSTTSHDNLVAYNLITDLNKVARDGGGIYLLGQQPGTIIEGNVIRRMKNDYACLYADTGAAFIKFTNNLCDTAPRWLHVNAMQDIEIMNTYTNVQLSENHGKDIRIKDTVYIKGQDWPPDAEAIIDGAGLEPEYSFLHEWLGE